VLCCLTISTIFHLYHGGQFYYITFRTSNHYKIQIRGRRGRDRMVVGNQCLSPLMLKVRIAFRRGVLNTTLCDIVCQ
jgi:hypothetical protein